jgi:DNA replication protein DnaC
MWLGKMNAEVISEVASICPKHGEYIAKTTCYNLIGDMKKILTSDCPDCVKEYDTARQEEQQGREVEKNRASLAKAGITPRFLSADFDNYTISCEKQRIALEACKDYASRIDEVLKKGENLLLIGAVGTGKNHLATGIAKAFLNAQKSVRIIKIVKLLRQIKDTYSPQTQAHETETQIMERLRNLDLLILDEVGLKSDKSGTMTETDRSLTYEIIDNRYEAIKPTVIISNLTRKDITAHIADDRVADRIKGAREILFNWVSYR